MARPYFLGHTIHTYDFLLTRPVLKDDDGIPPHFCNCIENHTFLLHGGIDKRIQELQSVDVHLLSRALMNSKLYIKLHVRWCTVLPRLLERRSVLKWMHHIYAVDSPANHVTLQPAHDLWNRPFYVVKLIIALQEIFAVPAQLDTDFHPEAESGSTLCRLQGILPF